MYTFKTYLEGFERNPYVYHVTYLKNLPGILKDGVIANKGYSPYQKEHIKNHSKSGVFLCTDMRCAAKWVEAMIFQAINNHINTKKLVPIIVRFKINRNKRRMDLLGGNEVENSFYSVRNINKAGVDFWNGQRWTNDINTIKQPWIGVIRQHILNGNEDILDDIYGYYPMPQE